MASHRMLSNKIVVSDEYLSLPFESQALYIQLNMAADDEGVVNNYESVMRMTGIKDKKYLKELIKKKYVLHLKSEKLILIKHWFVNNYIPKDRFKKSNYHDIIGLKCNFDENKSYTMNCIQNTCKVDTQVKLSKDNKRKYIKRKKSPAQTVYDDTENKPEDMSLINAFLKERNYE